MKNDEKWRFRHFCQKVKKRKKRQKRQKWWKWRFWWFLRFKRGFFILLKHPKILKIWCDAFFPSQVSAPNVSCFFNFRCSKRLMSVTRIKGLFLHYEKRHPTPRHYEKTWDKWSTAPNASCFEKNQCREHRAKKNYFFFRDFSCFLIEIIFTKFLDREKHTFSVLQKPNVFWKMQKTALKNVELEIFFQKKALKNVSLISKKRQKRQKRAKNSCFWGTCRKF